MHFEPVFREEFDQCSLSGEIGLGNGREDRCRRGEELGMAGTGRGKWGVDNG